MNNIQKILLNAEPSAVIDPQLNDSEQAMALANLAQAEQYSDLAEDVYRQEEEQFIKSECEAPLLSAELSSWLADCPTHYNVIYKHKGLLTKGIQDDKNWQIVLS